MATLPRPSLRDLPWLNIAIYAVAGAVAVTGLLGLPDARAQWIAIVLLLSFGVLLIGSFRIKADSWVMHPYLAVQTGLAVGLVLLRPIFVSFSVLYVLLGMQAMRLLPLRPALLWIVAIVIVSGLSFVITYTEYSLPVILPTFATYALFGAFGYTVRQAELARRRSQQLLEELQAAQYQLQELAVAQERNRLARDLHDSVKQQAFALSAQLDAAHSLFQRDPHAAETHLSHAEQLADTLRQELAGLIFELRPAGVGEGGLATALRRYASEWSEQSDIAASVSVQGERGLPVEIQHTLFRIVQEALANVARHSHARHVALQLDYTPSTVTLAIQDDGQGYDPQQVKAGLGTQSMRERAATLPNGQLTLDTQPDHGTRVTVQCDG